MSQSITALVDRGLEIKREIKTLQAELKGIEAKLESHGLKARQTALKDEDREGRRWLARGSGVMIPVIFTADKIIGSFGDNARIKTDICHALSVASGNLEDYFEPVKKWENRFADGKQFRAYAHEQLGQHAPAFITACLARDKHGLAKSDIKISWDDPEPLTQTT